MTYVITKNCCNDATCTAVCPVNCIHPTPDDPDFATADMLYIDPDSCISCGACMDACPVDAIHPASLLPPGMEAYAAINADYFASHPRSEPVRAAATRPAALTREVGDAVDSLRVAVVGTGPSAHYAAQELLRRRAGGVRISMIDRLPTPGGLLRFGVAPDHPGTKSIDRTFNRIIKRPEVSLFLDVEVGRHVDHAALLDHHDAVIYASGASGDRRLDIPGEELPGSHAARDFVAWYNGHPDAASLRFDLSSPRAVVVGNGNVALDVARVLLLDPAALASTDIADHALDELRHSSVEEVVLLGRRGPEHLACTISELLAFSDLDGIDVLVEGAGAGAGTDVWPPSPDVTGTQKLLADLARRRPTPGNKRLILRFHSSPTRIRGSHRVSGVDVVTDGETSMLEAGLVLRAIGYRGTPIPGLPFDDTAGTVPHHRGRVDGLDRTYVTGWIKRGPTGAIGTNRVCATESVSTLLDDLGQNPPARASDAAGSFTELIRARRPDYIDKAGWAAIDRRERQLGRSGGRPRVKVVDAGSARALAGATRPQPSSTRSPITTLTDKELS